jgi:hypothetical protein
MLRLARILTVLTWDLRILTSASLRDRDKDGVPDKERQVPGCIWCSHVTTVALMQDNDGVSAMQEDQCPDVFGLAQFHGCPDSDGDGIPDDKDACPFVSLARYPFQWLPGFRQRRHA